MKGVGHWFGSFGVPRMLVLTYESFERLPVADVTSLSDWNTWLVAHCFSYTTLFSNVRVKGTSVMLYGATDIGYFHLDDSGVTHLYDTGCIVSVNGSGFIDINTLDTVVLKATTSLGDNCFYGSSLRIFRGAKVTYCGFHTWHGCINMIEAYLPSITNLGGDVEDNGCFHSIIGNMFTLTVPKAIMTCNSSDPDGDVQTLQANNTVTLVQV